jgi:hypothetical protein
VGKIVEKYMPVDEPPTADGVAEGMPEVERLRMLVASVQKS